MKPLTPMTTEQRATLAALLVQHKNRAAPELVHKVTEQAEMLRRGLTPKRKRAEDTDTLLWTLPGVIRRLLDAEQQLTACRRVLAEVVVIADDSPDIGLTGTEVTQLAAAAGLDIRHDIEHAEQLRDAEQLAGAR